MQDSCIMQSRSIIVEEIIWRDEEQLGKKPKRAGKGNARLKKIVAYQASVLDLAIMKDIAEANLEIISYLVQNYATEFIRQGKSVMTLKQILGHSDIGTAQLYVTLVNKDVEEAIDGYKVEAI